MKKTAKQISEELKELIGPLGMKKDLKIKFMNLAKDVLSLGEKPAAEPKKKASKSVASN
jgi:hypothetical protein